LALSIFEEIANRDISCEIFGAKTISIHGGGWDNDRIHCSDRDCGAEYVFPTTTCHAETEAVSDAN